MKDEEDDSGSEEDDDVENDASSNSAFSVGLANYNDLQNLNLANLHFLDLKMQDSLKPQDSR